MQPADEKGSEGTDPRGPEEIDAARLARERAGARKYHRIRRGHGAKGLSSPMTPYFNLRPPRWTLEGDPILRKETGLRIVLGPLKTRETRLKEITWFKCFL